MYSAVLQFESQQKPVSPRDCGLAVAIPLDWNGFVEKLNRPAEGNFVQAFSQDRQNLSPQGLWALYEPFAKFAQDVATSARQRGVSVVLDASPDDFRRLLSKHEVVTLIAQWKSALFKPADIVDPPAVASDLRDPQSELSKALQQFSSVPPLSTSLNDAASVASFLNQCLVHGLVIPSSSNGEPGLGTITRFHYELNRRRKLLESVTFFRGGPSVEFSSGFLGLQEAVEIVARDFTGLLDLTVCNSVMLAESIRRARPHCSVLANEDLAYLDFRLAIYAEVLRNLVRRAEPYEDVVYRIRKELKEAGNDNVEGSPGALRRIRSAFWRRH